MVNVKLSRNPGSGELRVMNLHDLFARFTDMQLSYFP
jgi:hypothetical protein